MAEELEPATRHRLVHHHHLQHGAREGAVQHRARPHVATARPGGGSGRPVGGIPGPFRHTHLIGLAFRDGGGLVGRVGGGVEPDGDDEEPLEPVAFRELIKQQHVLRLRPRLRHRVRSRGRCFGCDFVALIALVAVTGGQHAGRLDGADHPHAPRRPALADRAAQPREELPAERLRRHEDREPLVHPQPVETTPRVRDGLHRVPSVCVEASVERAVAVAVGHLHGRRVVAGVCVGRLGRLGVDIEYEGLDGRADRLVLAPREQLLLAAELESHRRRDDALRAPDHLVQHDVPHPGGVVGDGDRGGGRLRDVREQHATRAAAHMRLDDRAARGVRVHGVGLVHHDQRVAARACRPASCARRVRAGRGGDAPAAEGEASSAGLERLAKHVELLEDAPTRRAARAHHQPTRRKERERLVASHVQKPRARSRPPRPPLRIVNLHHRDPRRLMRQLIHRVLLGRSLGLAMRADGPQHAMQRDERLASARGRLEVHVVVGAQLKALALVRRQLAALREDGALELQREGRGVGHGAQRRRREVLRPQLQALAAELHDPPLGLAIKLLQAPQLAVEPRPRFQPDELHRRARHEQRRVDSLFAADGTGERRAYATVERVGAQARHRPDASHPNSSNQPSRVGSDALDAEATARRAERSAEGGSKRLLRK